MQRRTRNYYNSSFKRLVINHITSNINLYLTVLIIFIVGICIGITVVNQLPDANLQSINDYISNSVNALKNNVEFSSIDMLKTSLLKNILLVLIIWIFGLTFLGNILLYIITLIIGITFGYTISAIMTSFTFMQGTLFFITGMLLQNIISIPSLVFITVQGLISHRELMAKQSNIKTIAAKYSIYAILVIVLLVMASFIEVYVSGKLIYSIAKYL